VACFIGDGAAMYSPQALWSAKRYGAPVVFLVFNNQKYDILMRVAKGLGSPNAVQGKFVGMTIDKPPIDFSALAKVAGIQYFCLDTVGEITLRLPDVVATKQTAVVEIAISGV
jgi:benzoylformate decarboxylase